MRDAITIVGGGLAGQVMALALAHGNMPCVLLGPDAPQAKSDHRTTAIMADGIALLQTLGLWDAAELQAVALRTMRLVSGEQDIAFAAVDIGLEQFGFNIANARLHDLLAQRIAGNPHITRVTASATEIDFSNSARVTIKCDDGQTLASSLVIGADGRHSIVRNAASIAIHQTALDQQALVCVVYSELPHQLTSTEFYYRGGPFTLVPMPDVDDAHRMAVVCCDTAAEMARLQNLSRDELGEAFTMFSQNRFGDLQILNDPQIWPVTPQRSRTLTASRTALIGEAAHVLPPLAAQGFNITLRDIQSLRDTIKTARATGLDVGQESVLNSYTAARALDMRLRGTGVDWLNRFIRQDDRIGRMAHGFGFRTLDRLPSLKRFVMRHALTSRKLPAQDDAA